LYQFVLHASPNLLELVLESVGNPQEVALALQRLRIIIGVSEIDMELEYQYHYIFSCCNDQIFAGPSDWENIISFTIDEIVNEIFMGPIYFTNDHEINIIVLPANLTECEMEFIHFNRIWGIKMKDNLLGDLDLFLQLETNLTEEAQEIQLLMMEKFMKKIANRFPNLINYKVDPKKDKEKDKDQTILSYVDLFNSIRKNIDSFLPQLLDKETERQAEILMPHMLPIVS
jgi:dihydroneopterin aldolase